MLPLLAHLAETPPPGTVTPTVLCDWLTRATGTPHAFAGELRDYPLFLSLHAGEPGRVRALVAMALGAQWEQDGATVRLVPVRPKEGEGFAEFERGFRAAVDPKSALASLPLREVFAMKAGRTLRFGYPESAYVRPLPSALRAKAMASEAGFGVVYLNRYANGQFATKVTMPGESRAMFSEGSQIDFRSLPTAVTAALGAEARLPVVDAEAKAKLSRLTQDPAGARVDPKAIDRIDPLSGFMDPLLGPLAATIKEDLVVALPDISIMATMGGDRGTVEGVMRGFSQMIDWSTQDGAFVGRLPVSERLNRAQTRRSVLASFVLNARATGVASAEALGAYLAAQRPQASESWGDVMMLVMSGVVVDETHLGDHPFNLRLGAALSGRDWDLLRAGRPVTMVELSPGARAALVDLMAQSRERMHDQHPDPALWRGFPNPQVALTAKVEDEAVLIGRRAGIDTVMTPAEAGHGYDRMKAELGREPLYRPARRRKLTLTVAQAGTGQSVETGFSEVAVDAGARPVAWRDLPNALAKAFDDANSRRAAEPGGS